MPVLEKLVVQDFRNIRLQELEFSDNLNCISGNNGEGKTNLIDAIYYLSMTKSAFSPTDKFNYRYGTNSFSISGTFKMENGLKAKFSIQATEGAEKKIRRDDKPYLRVAEHIGVLPVVMVSPSDIALVNDSGEERRKFVNSVLSQMDREYLHIMQQYNKLLMQRNVLLKSPDTDFLLLETFDQSLSKLADTIYQKREKFVKELAPVVKDYYRTVSGASEKIDIEYKSDVARAPLQELLAASRQKDMFLKYTSCGVHRDDFVFKLNDYPIRRCGSQGQQKSFLVALKFAQYDIMKRNYGFAPMLLLDDLFDKLDMGRMSNLLRMVVGNDFGQIFLSDTDKDRIAGIVDGLTSESSYYHAEGGAFFKQ